MILPYIIRNYGRAAEWFVGTLFYCPDPFKHTESKVLKILQFFTSRFRATQSVPWWSETLNIGSISGCERPVWLLDRIKVMVNMLLGPEFKLYVCVL